MENRSGAQDAPQDAGRRVERGAGSSADDGRGREAGDDRRPKSEGDRTQSEARDDKVKDSKKDTKTGRKDDRGDKGSSDNAAKNRSDDDKNRAAGEQARDGDRQDKRDADRADREGSSGDSKAREAAKGGDRKAADAVRSDVDEEKRAKVRDVAFRGDVKRATNVDVDVHIGVRLPRHVEIYAITDEIIAIAPAYRGYHYVVIDDAYCVVDPETYEVVDVIRAGGPKHAGSGGASARLDLTNAQIDVIRREIDGDRKSFDYDGDLEVGVALPGDISFETFPDPVVREVPEVRSYRYAVIEDEIAIVSPDGPEVVFVIGD